MFYAYKLFDLKLIILRRALVAEAGTVARWCLCENDLRDADDKVHLILVTDARQLGVHLLTLSTCS